MPEASRPFMPGYDLPQPAAGTGAPRLLPRSWAAHRLVQAHNHWLATSQPDGRPHAMPVWGVCLDDSLVFPTSDTSRKARNLTRDPRCTITTDVADEAVIVEGEASVLSLSADAGLLQRWVAEYQSKYKWAMDPAQAGIFRVRPRVAFGFIEHPDQFAATATRWSFAD